MRRISLLLAACFLAGVIAPGCSRRAPQSVFLIVVDTLRPDRLSCYGRRVYKTPSIDSLAVEGVRFTRAYAASGWAVPSVGAMMTSLYPTQLGLVETPAGPNQAFGPRDARDQRAYTLAPAERTLAEMMGNAGFVTAAFVNQPALNANTGFAQGFDEYYYPPAPDAVVRLDASAPREVTDATPLFERAREADALLIDEFSAWLDRNADKRSFAWIHLLAPHAPYTPPPWTARRSSANRGGSLSASDAYDGEVILADEMVGRIVDLIDANTGDGRSVVIVASSNGEEFGDGAAPGHGHSLRNELTWVPLIVRAPGAPAGTKVSATVRNIDIAPTVLDLAGASQQLPADVQGESLVPLFTSGGDHREVYTEGVMFGGTQRTLMVEGQHLLYDEDNDRHTLFDTFYDPEETVELSATKPALADSLRSALDALYRELVEDYSRRSEGRAAPDQEAARFKKAMSLSSD